MDEISDAFTTIVDVQDARKMGGEIMELLRGIPSDNSPGDYSDRVFNGLDKILKKYGYAPEEEEGAGHDMDRCAKHHAHNCPDCHPLPEDAEER
jgi:hypothetical protein